MQNFVAIGLGISAPQMRDFDVLRRVTNSNAFWVFETRKKDVVPAKGVPFRASMTKINIYTLKFPNKPLFLGPISTGEFLAAENRFKIVSLRVVLGDPYASVT